MNFTRWSARLPGTQRRAAARTDRGTGPSQTPNTTSGGANGSVPAARAETVPRTRPSAVDGAAAGATRRTAIATADDPAAEGPVPTLDGLSVHDVLGQVPALVAVVYGPEHRVAYVNDAYAALFGHRAPGAPARTALPELESLGLLPLMDQVLRSGKPRTVKSRRVTAEGGDTPRHGYYTFTCTPIEVGAAGAAPAPATARPPDPATGNGALPHERNGVHGKGEASDSYESTESHGPHEPHGPHKSHSSPESHNSPESHDGRESHGPSEPYQGVLVFAADVTDQIESAERLRASERRQREAAVTLQRSLLPQELEQPDDLRVAATYQPGGTEAAVGGDWYDVITLGAGRTALVIGDVMGRGVRAAAVMGQLRTAVRAYARLDLPPHEVLQLLDGLAAEIDASQIATCVYAVHDPNEGRLVYASAGHLPILVRDPDGTVRRAAEPTGPPLGTGGWVHTSGSVPLGPGASAVLYTDGLVERRDEDIDTGVASLERAFAGATGSPQVMCDRLLRALGITAEHDDDVAVLVLQHPARTGHDAELFHNAALELLGGIEAAPRARAFASGVLASWRFPTELRDLGVLAASELVANSLQHGTPPMRLRLRRTDRRLIIEVTDGDDHLPRRRKPEPADEAGRGISIIATIASSWGSRRTPGGGKAVWCEFALPTG
ncbi:SpoIIE family protein phosphatase [Streptomyces sp. NPDC050610]|uniref:SpoIIE family protein phosphatase n=1 Tax=Streptomyces sp. NPDC050610 TaxID=3157097 RepID=UPI0034122978